MRIRWIITIHNWLRNDYVFIMWFVLPDSTDICITDFPKLASNHEMTQSIFFYLLAFIYFKMYIEWIYNTFILKLFKSLKGIILNEFLDNFDGC